MSKKFNVADLLNDKSKEEVNKSENALEENQMQIEEIVSSGKSQCNTYATSRNVTLIAAEINNIKEQTRKMVLYNSIEIGRRLIEAKEMLEHGEWGKWLKESVDYSQRTANNLMKIFQEYGADQITLLGDNSKSQAFANLSYSQAIALLEVPEEEREDFIKENKVEDMSTRELQKVIKEKQELEEKLKVAEIKSGETEKLKKELKAIKDKNKEDLINREVEIENLKIAINNITKKLKKAQGSGNSEEVEKLQGSLQNAEKKLYDSSKKIEELEEKLKEKPIDVTETIVEKIPEEVEKELQELREKASNNDESTVKFSIYLGNFNKEFELLINTLNEIPKDEVKEQCKKTLIDTIDDMFNKL